MVIDVDIETSFEEGDVLTVVDTLAHNQCYRVGQTFEIMSDEGRVYYECSCGTRVLGEFWREPVRWQLRKKVGPW